MERTVRCGMLLVHEVHSVDGRHDDDFDAAYRDGYVGALGADTDARLLYHLHHAHGGGRSYRVVTITAVRDAAAWGRLSERIHRGDLRRWAEDLDKIRHDVTAKVLVAVPWSPLQDLDLASVPTTGVDHELTLFMEDTVWPYEGRLEDYVEKSGSIYGAWMASEEHSKRAMLRIEAAFRTAFGTGNRREIVLWQRVTKPEGLLRLLTTELPAEYKVPGNWMVDGLDYRDQWESRLLRTTRWSPLA
jgi:hypothetical protein